AARLKVSAALMPSLRDAPRTAAQRFHLDAPAWFRETPAPELLPAVADAVWDDRKVTARYRRQDTEVERELEPYGLVLKAGVWYLCARVPESGAYRVYRIDRFTAVAAGGERFARDEEFDLPGFWEERAEQFARAILRSRAVVRLSAAGVRQLPYATDRVVAREAMETAGEPDASGRVTVTLPVENEDVAYTQLMALGPEAEVLEPPGLRARFAEAAARAAALYR
ncbi:WYL domain-containing protein, partial [Streptomyces sp. SID10116]|nr:WYL domain-containing protein [Streptomyces sp. SID10116]